MDFVDDDDDDDFSDTSLVSGKITLKKYLFLPSGHFFWEVQSRKNKASYYVDNAHVRGFIIITTEKNAIICLKYLIVLENQITKSLFMETIIVIRYLGE